MLSKLALFLAAALVPFATGLVVNTRGNVSLDVEAKSVLDAESAVEASWDGNDAPLSETGYRQVAKMHSNEEMKKYVLRLLESERCTLKDERGLDGLVPFFSGEISTQGFRALQDEIWSAKGGHWVASGSTVTLTEDGYQRVATMKSNKEMNAFVLRIIEVGGCTVIDEAGLNGAVHFFSGVAGVQSMELLECELSGEEAKEWIADCEGKFGTCKDGHMVSESQKARMMTSGATRWILDKMR